MTHRSLAYILSVVALSAACGGSEPAPTQPANPAPSASAAAPAASEAPAASAAPAPSAAPSASAAPAETAAAPPAPPGPGEWDKWSKDQKKDYMKAAVMPKMGGLFHDFDSTKYEKPKCGLCHNAAAMKDGNFKMPNADLPKLPGAPGAMKKVAEKLPKMFDFMLHEVEPKMAALLGEEPFDMKTKKGFGCFNCHTKK